MDPEELNLVVRRHVLRNALEHGAADAKAVVGRVMAEREELRRFGKEVAAAAAKIIPEVNALSASEREAALSAIGPGKERATPSQPSEPKGLPPLPNARRGAVTMRFAPNPSGPATLGHARGMTIHWQYKTEYDAQLILRFDDTDPTVKRPMLEAYDWIPEDFRWLCGEPDRMIAASDRLALYYGHAEETIRKGGAYVCECEAQAFRDLKAAGRPCPHRDQDADSAIAKFRTMVAGGYKAGEAVLRIRTDIEHPNPALRDWVGVRIARDPHPRTGSQYVAWPLLDFQSAVDDHLTGVTHIIRGKDLRDSTLKQGFLYRTMGWTYPETLYWGRASVLEFGKFSKSILSDAIARGEYEGWDDPRLPTLRALRRRGFQAAAIRSFWLSFGLSEKDVAASMRTLESENRKVVEADAARYFFVADPTPLTIRGVAELRASAPLHPDHPDRGARAHHLRSRNDAITVELASQDAQGLRAGARVRLKDLANVELDSAASGRYAGNDLAFVESKSVPIVQWVPTDGLPTLLRMPDGTNVEGVSERAISKERLGSVVQLERVGYARVDALGPDRAVLYFSHK